MASIAESYARAPAVLFDEFDPKLLIRHFSGTAWLCKNLPEINGRLQNRLKWSSGALGLHPLARSRERDLEPANELRPEQP